MMQTGGIIVDERTDAAQPNVGGTRGSAIRHQREGLASARLVGTFSFSGVALPPSVAAPFHSGTVRSFCARSMEKRSIFGYSTSLRFTLLTALAGHLPFGNDATALRRTCLFCCGGMAKHTVAWHFKRLAVGHLVATAVLNVFRVVTACR